MKCYIATFHQYDNYGTRLQNFALCAALRKLGAEPVSLAVTGWRDCGMRVVKDVCSYLPAVCSRQSLWANNRKKRAVFQSFNKQLNTKGVSCRELYRLDFTDAVAIAGSDQIWSPAHLAKYKRERELYFLEFAPKGKRYAYAPSFGAEVLPGQWEGMYRERLAEFARLSVRETAGRQIIEDLMGRSVPVLPDPIFLLGRKEWAGACSVAAGKGQDGLCSVAAGKGRDGLCSVAAGKGQDGFVLTYFLGQPGDGPVRAIEKFAADNQFRIVSVAGNHYKKGDVIPSPDEFVRLIGCAQAVFTDSFHASAFSIMMGTPFLVYRREDAGQFSRLETLLAKYGYGHALAHRDTPNAIHRSFLDDIPADVEAILERERAKGLGYLETILRDGGNDV